MEEMLEGAGIGTDKREGGDEGGRSVPPTSTPTPHIDTPETLIPTQHISLNEGEIEGEGEGK
jgi:hypothetical protein